MHWRIPVTRYSAWPPELALADGADGEAPRGDVPDVTFVEPMLRRRLGRLARMALWVAHDCAGDCPQLRLVFASRHGELSRSLGLLRELAQNELLSPAAFGLSVHNAAAGILSILRADTSPATAIAAGRETFGMALLEAVAQLRADPASPVMVVYADEPVPEDYAAFATPGETPHAVAMLLESSAPRQIECGVAAGAGEPSAKPQSLAFLEGIRFDRPASWSSGERLWTWH